MLKDRLRYVTFIEHLRCNFFPNMRKKNEYPEEGTGVLESNKAK